MTARTVALDLEIVLEAAEDEADMSDVEEALCLEGVSSKTCPYVI